MSDRAEYIKGLRALADVLEARPEVGLPSPGAADERSIPVYLNTLYGHDPLTGALAYIAAMNEQPTLTFEDHNHPPIGLEERPNYWLKVEGEIHGVCVRVCLIAHQVCELVDGELVIPPALLAAPTRQYAAPITTADHVLAALAATLTSLPDVRHERVVMTAAVLARWVGVTPGEAAEMAANDCNGETARSAWREATRLLDLAAEQALAVADA